MPWGKLPQKDAVPRLLRLRTGPGDRSRGSGEDQAPSAIKRRGLDSVSVGQNGVAHRAVVFVQEQQIRPGGFPAALGLELLQIINGFAEAILSYGLFPAPQAIVLYRLRKCIIVGKIEAIDAPDCAAGFHLLRSDVFWGSEARAKSRFCCS